MSEKPAGSKREQTKQPNRYAAIIKSLFARHYKHCQRSFEFTRGEFEKIAHELQTVLPKDVGDLIYSFRFRTALPEEILATAAKGMEWSLKLAGRARYRFKSGRVSRIVPRHDLRAIKIPDSTPEIIAAYAMTDEQALLVESRMGAGAGRHGRPGSHPRSSNRTCRFPASSFPTGFCDALSTGL